MACDFLAGCLGGCAGVIVGHPLDTVKVHLQIQDPSHAKYAGTLSCLTKLVKTEGVRGVYRGMSSPLAGVAAINAIVFGVYGNVQRNLSEPNSLMSHFLAGSAAGLCQSVFCSPIELAKTRLQISGGTGPLDCLRQIHALEGTRGVFRGLTPTILREVPSFGTYFLTYEFLTRSDAPVSTWTMLLGGGCAGMTSWLVSYPVDVLKTRLQMDGCEGVNKYEGLVDCYRKSVAREGYRFLFRGLAPTLVRAFPVNAACFTVVTWSMRIMEGGFGVFEETCTLRVTLCEEVNGKG